MNNEIIIGIQNIYKFIIFEKYSKPIYFQIPKYKIEININTIIFKIINFFISFISLVNKKDTTINIMDVKMNIKSM
jgi:hypothetical protein